MKNVRMLLVGVLALGFMVVRLGNASSLDDEALTHAKKIVGQFVAQCGQDHYLLIRVYDTGDKKLQEAYKKGVGKLQSEVVIQIHGLRVEVKPDKNLSPADKLNGIEWSGQLLINAEATRSTRQSDKWLEWQTGEYDEWGGGNLSWIFNSTRARGSGKHLPLGPLYKLVKQGGKWTWDDLPTELEDDFPSRIISRMDCARLSTLK